MTKKKPVTPSTRIVFLQPKIEEILREHITGMMGDDFLTSDILSVEFALDIDDFRATIKLK